MYTSLAVSTQVDMDMESNMDMDMDMDMAMTQEHQPPWSRTASQRARIADAAASLATQRAKSKSQAADAARNSGARQSRLRGLYRQAARANVRAARAEKTAATRYDDVISKYAEKADTAATREESDEFKQRVLSAQQANTQHRQAVNYHTRVASDQSMKARVLAEPVDKDFNVENYRTAPIQPRQVPAQVLSTIPEEQPAAPVVSAPESQQPIVDAVDTAVRNQEEMLQSDTSIPVAPVESTASRTARRLRYQPIRNQLRAFRPPTRNDPSQFAPINPPVDNPFGSYSA